MDNLTHTLTGLALSRAGLSRTTAGATVALALSSNLPDIDILSGLNGTAAYLQHHRDLTHSVLGAPVEALALAAVLRLAVKGSRSLSLFLCTALGIAVHVFMDLWTSYGTRVLAPFDRTWYTWDLVFIADPLILALLGASILLARRLGPQAAAVGLGLLLSYVGGRAVLHARALDETVARVPSGGVVRAAALPAPINPFRWEAVADVGDAYWTGEVRLLGPSAPPFARREKQPETTPVREAREGSRVASIFLDFSRFPWLEVEPAEGGTAVIWTDLRFERPGRESFMTRVLVGSDGRIRSEAFRF